MHHGRHQRSGRVDCSGPQRHVLRGGHALYRRRSGSTVSEPPRSFTGTRPAAAMRSDGCAWGTCTRTTAARVGTSARITTISAKFRQNRIRTFWHTSAFVMRPKRGSRRAATSWETCWPRAEAVRLIMRRRSTCSCGRTCVTDIAAGEFYTKYMIEEDDTMDEVVKADSSAGKT